MSLEVFWTGLASFLKGDNKLVGVTNLWMLPIYGFAAISFEIVHNNIKVMPWLARGVIYVVLIFIIEYSTGWLIKRIIGVCPWDYTASSKLSINGFIRLDYAPAWFTVGLLFEKAHNIILKLF